MARKPAHPAPQRRFPFTLVQIGVRLEEGLRRRLERAASHSGQSMNAEIVERLKRSFQSDEDKISLIARAIIDTYPDIANRIEELFAEARLWRQVRHGAPRGREDKSK
jgi:plasmid stability protein